MKKILALVLALALTLTAVVALAAPSPDNPGGKVTPAGGGTGGDTGGNTGTVTPEDEKTDVEVADAEAAAKAIEEAKTATELVAVNEDSDSSKATKQSLKDAADKNGDALSVLPEKMQEELKKEGLTAVNEMVTVVFSKGLDSKNLTFKVSVQTPYKAGERVAVLIAVPGEDGEVEWISVPGTATGKGEIVFTVDEATYNKVAGEEVVVVPASEPAK